MIHSEQFMDDYLNPIDIVENIAEYHDWDFDRIGDDQIAMAVQGQWRTYSITLAWSDHDKTLRQICTFEMEPPEEKLPVLYKMLNEINDQCWTGAFNYWSEQKLMVYRYGLITAGTLGASPEQVDMLITSAVVVSEQYYPALQLAIWGDRSPRSAIQIAIGEAYGCA
ncbi:MAG: YbjN domain-containing protein [Roseovarius sp.]|nr:YbjN domain-containing protein [Roseovarius sp.]MCY4207888.1 YbjN domain-containing protein [Roseovarius sp.]MCY4291986.1 YbjN domain-containing protein [Roseovarius sp.]